MTTIELEFRLKNHPSLLHARLNWSAPMTLLRSPSGTGKSTFFELLAGFGDTNTVEGKFKFGEFIFFDTYTHIWRKSSERTIAWMPQDFALVPYVEARHQIFADSHPKRDYVLGVLECDQQLMHRAAGDLSLGQQQRIALARALLSSHPLLLLDEPYHALDLSLRIKAKMLVQETIEREQRQAIIISHEIEDRSQCTKELTIDKDGQLIFVS